MSLQANLKIIHAQIIAAESKYGRSAGSVQLLVVSKKHSAATIAQAAKAGQTLFGESYVQEALSKIQALQALNLEWHFIGPIQSNKTKAITENFSWVHSVASLKHAQRLDKQRPATLPPLHICIQVNISNEASKSGINLTELSQLAQQITDLPNLRLRGLMTIPAKATDFAAQRQAFHAIHNAFKALQQQGLPLDTLSMGMSHDFVAAIAEGATLVRIGTAILGERTE